MFRDNALKLLLRAGFEQCITITIKLIAKLDTALVIGSKQTPQVGSTLRECFLSEVFAIEMQNVEGVKDDAIRLDSMAD